MSEDQLGRLADGWASTVLRVLGTEYPYAAQHTSTGPDDVDVTPARLHPAFHGSFDWHSSAHMHWSAVRLLGSGLLPEETRRAVAAVLDERLSVDACATEAAYLRAHPSFERPYGWGWVAMLAAATHSASPASGHATATRPLYDAVADLVVDWLPRLAYPVRQGEHANTAFGLALVHEAATVFDDDRVATAVASAATTWFGADRDYPVGWEPGGSDFLSPALCEADLMRRVLPGSELGPWLAGFLPGLGAEGDPLLGVPDVHDRTDGKAVHLFGLALSRAWQLRLLLPHLPADRRPRVTDATARQVAATEAEISDGDFMSTHWLVSFALLAADAADVAGAQG